MSAAAPAGAAPARAADDSARSTRSGSTARCCCSRAAAAALSALIFGLVPAIRYTRPNVLACLRHGGRSATDHPGRQRGRHLLVVAQTAMALVLLVGSGLLARSFARLMDADQGFVPRNVLTFRVALPPTTYPEVAGGRAVHPAAGRSPRRAAGGRGRGRDHRAAGRAGPVGHRVRVRRTSGRGRPAAAARPVLDGDAGLLQDAADRARCAAPTSTRAICATACAPSSSTRRPRRSSGRGRMRSASGCAASAAPPNARPWYTVKGVVARRPPGQACASRRGR